MKLTFEEWWARQDDIQNSFEGFKKFAEDAWNEGQKNTLLPCTDNRRIAKNCGAYRDGKCAEHSQCEPREFHYHAGGRSSSSKPNFQELPKEKEIVITEECIKEGADYLADRILDGLSITVARRK